MPRKITMTEDKFREIIREAFMDGFEDGNGDGPAATITDWESSVSFDRVNYLIQKNRDGGKI